MKITAIETLVCHARMRNWIFVKILTDQPGLVGWGEATLEWHTRGVVGSIEDLADLVVGEDPTRIEHLWQMMYRQHFWHGHGVVRATAISGIDLALWDIAGKLAGVPCHRLWGGRVREFIRLYCHLGGGKLEDFYRTPVDNAQRFAELAHEAVCEGYTAAKTMAVPPTMPLEGLQPIKSAAACVAALREAVGDGFDLMVDCHARPSPAMGLKFAQALDDYGLYFLEEPCWPEAVDGLARINRAVTTPIATGERVTNLEAFYIATDAPSHARLAIMALNHGKHVVSAVPAVFGFEAEEDAEALFEAVKKSGKKYMMNETSTFHAALYAKRMQYQAGALGKIIYSEGEYYHDNVGAIGSYNPSNGEIDGNGWRRALVPMWYPTHATAYYVSVTGGGRLTDVSCLGTPSLYPEYKDGNNAHKNPFGTEVALFKTSEGGMARMAMSWDMKNAHGEQGRVYGQKPHNNSINGARPALPPGVGGGGHGGSHGQLTNDFIESILLDRKPIVDVSEALNMTLAGVIAHKSALRDGEWMKIPQYKL